MSMLIRSNCKSKLTRRLLIVALSIVMGMLMMYYLHPCVCTTRRQGERTPASTRRELPEEGSGATSTLTCTPITNVYYLKVHKTGSTTMYALLNRAAFNYKLRVVPYRSRPFVHTKMKHPIISSILPKYNGETAEPYNMLIDHTIFDQADIETVLKKPVTFFTMLRNPTDRMRSYMYFTGKGKTKYKSGNKSFTSYFDPLTLPYRRTNMLAVEFGVNQQSALQNGKPTQYFVDYVNRLDKLFLIGITEYYDHSVVLMKRHFCWRLQDVLFMPLRKQNYHDHVSFDAQRSQETFCSQNILDCYLYDYFNRTFWRKVTDEGPGFWQELEQFKSIQREVSAYLTLHFEEVIVKNEHRAILSALESIPPVRIAASQWNKQFSLMIEDCVMMWQMESTISNYNYYTQNPEACKNVTSSSVTRCRSGLKLFGPKYCDTMCQFSPDRKLMLKGLLSTNGALLLT